ncbi:MAG: hypothetical protein PF636_08625 [Actinomycetota bacterium]|jgi:FlaA1/EpsC-like NDP-sugar epimerase|nr:hypothetical protein [Actinomycetota bacterium]
MLWFERPYSLDRVFWGTGEYTRAAKALVLAVVGVVLAEYALKLGGIARLWIGFSLIFSVALVILGRAAVRAGIVGARKRGRLLKPTLIVGCSPEAADIVHVLHTDTAPGLVPVGCLAARLISPTPVATCTMSRVSATCTRFAEFWTSTTWTRS